MQKVISIVLLIGVAASAYASGVRGTVEEFSKTTSSFGGGAYGKLGHELEHQNLYQQESFQGYPGHGQYSVQYWNSFGINPIHGTSYCSCPAGFLNQGFSNQGLYNQGFMNQGIHGPSGAVETFEKSVQHTSSVIPNAFNGVVQAKKEFISHHGSGY